MVVLAVLDDGGEIFEFDVLAHADIVLAYYAGEHDTRSISSSKRWTCLPPHHLMRAFHRVQMTNDDVI
jgi:hypothetical protein